MEKKLKELLEKAEIKDFKNLSINDIKKITELQSKNELTKAHIKALIKVTPEFVKMQIEFVKSYAEVTRNMKDVQIKAIDPIIESIKNLSKILEIIALNALSEEVQIKVLETSEKIAENYERILEINLKQQKENNHIWHMALIGFITLAGSATAFFLGRGGKSD